MLKAYYKKGQIEAGTDEAGRGCLAGPVVAAAVVLSKNFKHLELRDSKKLTYKKRLELAEIIKSTASFYSIQHVSPEEIDRINILNASIRAMHLSLDDLETKPEFILVDGNRFKPYQSIPFACIIKGDDKYLSIAAASVLAKVERDHFMEKQAQIFPEYGWERNKGYPTKFHREAIREYGITPLHRKSFKLLRKEEQLRLFVRE